MTPDAVAVAEDDDIEHSTIFPDLRDNNCESNKTAAATKKFNFFLEKCCDSKGHNSRTGFE